ncbi:ubiquitin carboxyl-terminal hydrolase [Lipomyces kononenkoae]|uniref:Ubiquitin carboxyl-terminal hydrolase n=1 Tax=Lipomyces kononenkoae TaxID=34357 RepID=A0ACC3T884_LIPKO
MSRHTSRQQFGSFCASHSLPSIFTTNRAMSSSGWNTLESDAGVFTELVESLGVKSVELHELLSLDADQLRAVAPLYGVVFLFKYIHSALAPTTPGVPQDGSYDPDAEHAIFFAHQKIQNACATQAILSIVLNRSDIQLGSALTEFKTFVEGFDSELRGETLSNSELIRLTHNSFSRPTPFVDESQPQRQAGDDDDLYHFIAYVPINGTLYELDGLQPYPISHGECTDETFAENIVEVLYRRIARYPEDEVRFNLLAVCHDRRELLAAVGDTEGLLREEEKRAEWRRENILRRENFVGLIYEVLKGVLGDVVENNGGIGAFEKMISDAKAKTQKRLEDAQRRRMQNNST